MPTLEDLQAEIEDIRDALMEEYDMAAGIAEEWAKGIVGVMVSIAEVCNGNVRVPHVRGKDG